MLLPTGMLPPSAFVDQTAAPSRTYRIDVQRGRCFGVTDGLDAVRQYVAKTLRTDRFFHAIYGPDYGSEVQVNASVGDIERWVREALLQDDRISAIEDFTAVRSGDTATVSFTVVSSLGRMAMTEVIGDV